jgi:hypothetical protein
VRRVGDERRVHAQVPGELGPVQAPRGLLALD